MCVQVTASDGLLQVCSVQVTASGGLLQVCVQVTASGGLLQVCVQVTASGGLLQSGVLAVGKDCGEVCCVVRWLEVYRRWLYWPVPNLACELHVEDIGDHPQQHGTLLLVW